MVSALVTLAWVLLLWFRLATRAATPGMRVMKLQLVGFYDGRPIGLARALIRGVILWLLSSTVIGLVVMVILLVLHPRKQGWHDLAAKAVMIKERTLAPGPPATPAAAVAAAPHGGPQQGYAPPGPAGLLAATGLSRSSSPRPSSTSPSTLRSRCRPRGTSRSRRRPPHRWHHRLATARRPVFPAPSSRRG